MRVVAVCFALLVLNCSLARSENLASPVTETIPHIFVGGTDGAVPWTGRLIADAQGNLYGTTQQGGTGTCTLEGYTGCGTVFELSPVSDVAGQHWTETIIHEFSGPDGSIPLDALVFDKYGNLFGTTFDGGTGSGCSVFGCGVIFELRHSEIGWTEQVLYSFTGGEDGSHPAADLIFDAKGNIYGTTPFGGHMSYTCTLYQGQGCGVVFELQPAGHSWVGKILHTFVGADGAEPLSGLIFGPDGSLYGTTYGGGYGGGVVFQLVPHANGKWTERLLENFGGNMGYGAAHASVVLDKKGNLYGTTVLGGGYGGGSVFELSKLNGTWTQTWLHSFTGGADGGYPYGGVIFDASGNLYGTASSGGNGYSCPQWCGLVFELTNQDGVWMQSILHDFQGGTDGEYPGNTLLMDNNGNLYGTTLLGGDESCQVYPPNSACGIVFEINRAAPAQPLVP